WVAVCSGRILGGVRRMQRAAGGAVRAGRFPGAASPRAATNVFVVRPGGSAAAGVLYLYQLVVHGRDLAVLRQLRRPVSIAVQIRVSRGPQLLDEPVPAGPRRIVCLGVSVPLHIRPSRHLLALARVSPDDRRLVPAGTAIPTAAGGVAQPGADDLAGGVLFDK